MLKIAISSLGYPHSPKIIAKFKGIMELRDKDITYRINRITKLKKNGLSTWYSKKFSVLFFYVNKSYLNIGKFYKNTYLIIKLIKIPWPLFEFE